MSVTNPDKVVTKQDLANFYEGIFPYLGGMPEMLANKFSRADLYSTTEKVVGCWTDGRPIYQKTISCGTLPNSNTTTIATGVSSINRVINIEGYSRRNTDGLILPLPYVDKTISGGNVASVDLVYVASSNVIRITTGTDRSTFTETYVTIQYTKTTDSANSFKYANENDYSTTEKIVGTWIDGKPLYQKTFNCGALPNNTNQSITHNISNFGTLINAFGWCKKTDGKTYVIPESSADGIILVDIPASTATTAFRIRTSGWESLSQITSYNAYVTLQYTKTTD